VVVRPTTLTSYATSVSHELKLRSILCNASLRPTGPVGAPLCVNLPLPVCTYRQYQSELRTISNPLYNEGPLGVEEHLASDYGCKIGAATVRVQGQLADYAYGLEMLVIIACLFYVAVLRSWHTTTKGQCNGKGTESVEVHRTG